MKTSHILRKAREAIAERGWNQRSRRNIHGGMCAMGALCLAAYDDAEKMIDDEKVPGVDALVGALPDVVAVDQSLLEHYAVGCRGQAWRVMAYNDTFARTRDEVLSWFDRAALRAERIEAMAEPAKDPVSEPEELA